MVQWLVYMEREAEGGGIKSVQWSDVDSDAMELDSSNWCFATMSTPIGPAGTLLVDSGADDHICDSDFAKGSPLKKRVRLTLRGVQSNPSCHHGARHVNLRVRTQKQRAIMDFQSADISDNILSLGKLLRNGFVFSFKGENESIMHHQSDPTTTVPFFLHKNGLRIHATPFVHHVSPVVEDDMPLRLSSRSPLTLLDRRLDELALQKHGAKLDKWTRLEKRVKELVRERKPQAAIDVERVAGPEGRRRDAAIPIADPREPSNTYKDVHERTHLPGPQPWCEQCFKERGMENPHKRGDVRTCGIYTPRHRIRFLFHQDLWNCPWRDRRRGSNVPGVP